MAGNVKAKRSVRAAPKVVTTAVVAATPGPIALDAFVVTQGPGSPDEPLGGPEHTGVKLGQSCGCGASFLVWQSFFDAGEGFACPACDAPCQAPRRTVQPTA